MYRIMDVNKILKTENQIPWTESDDNLNLSENGSLFEGKMSEEWTDGELEENEILSEEISSYNSDLDIYARDVSKYSLKTPSTGSYFYGSPYNIRCLGEIELSRSSRYLNPFNFFPLVALDIDLQDHLWTPEEPPIYDDIGVERYLDLVKENKAEIVQDIISQLHTETMNLKYYGLKNRSYKILLEVLKYNKHIKHLDLTNNVIDSVDVANIFSDMIKQNNTLESINLSFCNIGPEYIKIICKHLGVNKNIKELNLSHCNLGDEGVKALAEELGPNIGLRKLDISYNNLTASCCQDLGDAIFDNNDLMDLNLSGNTFKEGFAILAANLRDNFAQKLQRIGFSTCGLGVLNDRSLKILLQKVSGLKYLDLSKNRIQDSALESVIFGMRRNPNLLELNLAYNPLTFNDMLHVMENLKVMKPGRKLKVLDLTDKYIPKQCQEIVEQISPKRNIIFRGYLCDYSIKGPNMKLLFINRLKAMCEPKKTKPKNKDKFGSFFYAMEEDYVRQRDWYNFITELCQCPRLTRDKEFIKGLAKQFTDETKKVNVAALRDMYLETFPETKKPPSPKEELPLSVPKKKKKKEVKEKGKVTMKKVKKP